MDESRRDLAKELSDLMKEMSVTGTCNAEVNKADLHNAEKEQDDMFHRKLFVGNIGYRVSHTHTNAHTHTHTHTHRCTHTDAHTHTHTHTHTTVSNTHLTLPTNHRV